MARQPTQVDRSRAERASDDAASVTDKAKQVRSRYTGKLDEIIAGFGRYAQNQRATHGKIADEAMRRRLAG